MTDETDPIAAGDRVRSFDFALTPGFGRDLDGPRAAYVDGVVEAVGEDILEGCPRYRIRAERRVSGGREVPVRPDERVYPPLNGLPTTLGETTRGVEKLTGSDLARAILAENPALSEPGFANRTRRWTALEKAADRLGLTGEARASFVAFGMTDGAEGALPDSIDPRSAALEIGRAFTQTEDS